MPPAVLAKVNALIHQNAYDRYSAVAYLMAGRSQPGIAAFDTLFNNHADQVRPAWRENYVHALLAAGLARRALPHMRILAEHTTGEKQIRWQEILLYQYLQLDMLEPARTYALLLTRQAPTRAKWWKALTHVYLQDGQYTPALTAMIVYSYLETLSDQEAKLRSSSCSRPTCFTTWSAINPPPRPIDKRQQWIPGTKAAPG